MEFEDNRKGYFAIIPASIRYDQELSSNAKLLYGEITALCNERGFCWATNEYFANLYGVSKKSITRWIASLVDRGYLELAFDYESESNKKLKRIIKLKDIVVENVHSGQNCPYPMDKNVPTPMDKNVPENNTSINNTSNTKKEKIYKKEKSQVDFVPPTLEEVAEYCKERNNNIDPQVFFDYYSKGHWNDSKGEPVRNWKQRMISWEARDSKAPEPRKDIHVFKEPTYDDSKNIKATEEQLMALKKMRGMEVKNE